MSNYQALESIKEEEGQWIEFYDSLSKYMSAKIRGMKAKDRLPVLRELCPTDLSLMNLYLTALKNEDYETCAVSKILLDERGYKIPE